MIKPPAILLLISLSILLAPRPASADAGEPLLTLRFDPSHKFVEVINLNDREIAAIKKFQTTEEWHSLFYVYVVPAVGKSSSPMSGKYQVVDKSLRFVPLFPFEPGVRYWAEYVPEVLGPDYSRFETGLKRLIGELNVPLPKATTPTTIQAIFPSVSQLPENQLKLYLYFSAPMGRGESYKHIRLRDAKGNLVERPFLELGEELWNPEMTRLTLLFDPGRIKRGLKPREEEGPILEAGKSYTFEISDKWPDANGHRLARDFRKEFRVAGPDESQPDPKNWRFKVPTPGTRNALTVTFPEPLDQAMLQHAIRVEADGKLVSGKVEVGPEEKSWLFTPDSAWPTGDLVLVVNPELEDLAGNSIARAFEVDNVGPEPAKNSRKMIRVPVPKE